MAFRLNGGSLILGLYVSPDARENRILDPAVHVGRTRDVGRRFMLSVKVDDVDKVYGRLRGLEGMGACWEGMGRALVTGGLTEPRTRPWGVRTMTFQDPAGHCWEVGQVLDMG